MADSKKYGRTANLFDYQTMEGTIKGYYLDSNGDLQESAYAAVTDYIPCSGGKFCLAKVGGISTSICLYDNNKHFLYGQAYNTSSGSDKQTIVVNSSVNASYIRFTYFYTAAPQDDLSTIMLNTGSTALPYEPYLDWLHSLRKLGTSTDTITTLPADLYADGNNATVGLVGNMQQTGTPSPQNPIQPQESGERTGNLLDKDNLNVYKGYYNSNTGKISAASTNAFTYIPIEPNTKYYFSGLKRYNANEKILLCTTASAPSNGVDVIRTAYFTQMTTSSITTTSEERFIALYLCGDADYAGYGSVNAAITANVSETMINTGSTALPYEPYGYKLDIKSANTTTPVYLGEVESTRKIYQQIFKGDENWQLGATNLYTLTLANSATAITDGVSAYSSHYQGVPSRSSYSQLYSDQICIRNTGTQVWIRSNDITTETDFKTYLQQQYANGTPVTVWYVLATPTTGIVNEPLRKIGDYVDTVSGISIPTITGADSFDVLTTLKPSEVELTYTGWHDTTVKEWDGSQWQ